VVAPLMGGQTLHVAGQVFWSLGDNQNTVRDLAEYVSGVTTLTAHRAYDAFGMPLSTIGPPTLFGVFDYTGRYYDPATGLQWNLHRWYNPRLQRWMGPDPDGFGGGDANLYRYCGNSPLTNSDPTGEKVWGSELNFQFTFICGGQFTVYRLWDDSGRQAWVVGGSARVGLHGDLSLNGVLSQGTLPQFIEGLSWDVSAGGKCGVGASGGYNSKAGCNGSAGIGFGGGASAGFGGSGVLWKNY
jgi:RHS repeat-associated protein